MKSKKYMLMLLLMAPVTFLFSGATGFSETVTPMRDRVVVFAAASTTDAITEIGERFKSQRVGNILPSFAASSTLAKQIAQGAPADIYLSANKEWMDYLEDKNLIVKSSRFDLLSNRIVLIAPLDSPLKHVDVKPGFSLLTLLGEDGRLAIGDPDYVPAGKYGKEALQTLGCWNQVKDRLAPAKDVRAALVLVERQESPVGLVYATDAAFSKKVRVIGTFPLDSHPPIVYPVAIMAGAKAAEAGRFMDFLKTPEARDIFQKYGFEVR